MPEFSCKNVWERGRPVLYAVHGADGDWQLLCGGDEHGDGTEIVVVHTSHLVERDATVAEVLDLPAGWAASRESAGAPWTRGPDLHDDADGDEAFLCAHCGIVHAGLPTDQGFKLPDDVWAIPENERAAAATYDSDLCQLGERFFIRCILRVPFTERQGVFGWGVWVEVSKPDFARYVQRYNDDASDEPETPGTLANRLEFYPDADCEPVWIMFGTARDRPDVMTHPRSGSSLARDQWNGIDDARYHALLEAIGTA